MHNLTWGQVSADGGEENDRSMFCHAHVARRCESSLVLETRWLTRMSRKGKLGYYSKCFLMLMTQPTENEMIMLFPSDKYEAGGMKRSEERRVGKEC